MGIILKNISKKYKTKEALSNVNLTFASKGMVMLTGENGSGKTTLLNIIGLLDDNYLGEISLNNIAISELKNNEVHQLRGSIYNFIFQESNLIEDVTVKDNLSIYKNMKGIDANETSFINNVESLLTKYPKTLSGGERQKIAITRGLYDGEIILCDEPVASLDYQSTIEVMDKLKEISKTKLVIVVMHDKELVELYADRIIEIKNGVVIRDNVITETEELNLSVEAQKINIRVGLSKLITSFFKKRPIKSFMFFFLLTVMIILLTLVSSLVTYDPIPPLASRLITGDKLSLRKAVEVINDNFSKSDIIAVTSGKNFDTEVNDVFKSEEYDYEVSTSYGKVIFTDNIEIEKGKALVDLDIYFKITHTTTFRFGYNISIKNLEAGIGNLELEIIGISDEKGIYASKASLDRNDMSTNEVCFRGGMFLNNQMKILEDYYDVPIYMPLSYFKQQMLSLLAENTITSSSEYEQTIISKLQLDYNQVGISHDLGDYLNSDSKNDVKFSFVNLSSKEEKFSQQFINLNDTIYPDGAGLKYIFEDYSELIGNKFLVVNDQTFHDILSHIPCYNRLNIIVSKDNKTKVARFFMESNYKFNEIELSEIASIPTRIKNMQSLVVSLIVIFVLSLFMVLNLLSSTILISKRNEIGLLQSFGFTKSKSLLPSFIVSFILLSLALVFSFLLSPSIFKYINKIGFHIEDKDTAMLVFNGRLVLLVLLFIFVIYAGSILANFKKLKKYSAKEIFKIS